MASPRVLGTRFSGLAYCRPRLCRKGHYKQLVEVVVEEEEEEVVVVVVVEVESCSAMECRGAARSYGVPVPVVG
ncbi:hypothetical protein OIU74_021593 [Salix koriyanagi]|uniref:Uncharacterized protein n=1 Tax=Salix koriyanagi TaxID=2511006 RepID=A0A9Q0WKV2_9ROSI|nr:hypothetical protein OIU74_021593 [Salix koriyanagi]